MNIPEDPPAYHTYLFTIWKERSVRSGVDAAWRYRLEDPHSGKSHLFATLSAVVQFLEQTYRLSRT